MNIEDQVASLELAKKLLTLGVKQNSLFYWVRMPIKNKHIEGYGLTYGLKIYQEKENFKEIFSAFTATELGKILPRSIVIKHEDNEHGIRCFYTYYLEYDSMGFPLYRHSGNLKHCLDYKTNESEANARAKMIISLIEEGLMKINKDADNGNS